MMDKEKVIEEIFKKTYIKKHRGRDRRYYKGMAWARVLYYLINPDYTSKGFCIHHKDLNPLNDNIDNLKRLTKLEHFMIHNIQGSGTNARIIMAEYQIFITIKAAAKAFSVSSSTIIYRIKNNVPGYFYISNTSNKPNRFKKKTINWSIIY